MVLIQENWKPDSSLSPQLILLSCLLVTVVTDNFTDICFNCDFVIKSKSFLFKSVITVILECKENLLLSLVKVNLQAIWQLAVPGFPLASFTPSSTAAATTAAGLGRGVCVWGFAPLDGLAPIEWPWGQHQLRRVKNIYYTIHLHVTFRSQHLIHSHACTCRYKHSTDDYMLKLYSNDSRTYMYIQGCSYNSAPLRHNHPYISSCSSKL